MKEEKKAVLITFSVKSSKFESHYERNKFFRGLYGWKQTIRKGVIVKSGQQTQEKVYEYHREGLLDEIPHEKVDQSSFIVPEDEIKKVVQFMREWHDKVMWKSFKVLLEDEDIFENFRKQMMEEEE